MIDVIFSNLASPLSIIKSQILLLSKRCNDSNYPLLGETLSFCEDSIESIQGFIEKINFLYFSDNRVVTLKPEWSSLKLLINLVFTELRHQNMDINRIKLNDCVADFIIIPDKCLFIRILVNLLSNALKFST
jgi:signal transduction histidine kinase